MLLHHPSEGFLVAVLTFYYYVTFRLHCFLLLLYSLYDRSQEKSKTNATNLQQNLETILKGSKNINFYLITYYFSLFIRTFVLKFLILNCFR